MTNSKYKIVTGEEFKVFTDKATSVNFNPAITLFSEQIFKMNTMYKLPINNKPTLEVGEPASVRIQKFITTLNDEIKEGVEIQENLKKHENLIKFVASVDPEDVYHNYEMEDRKVELLTDLSDWFADIIVYCRSEAMKFGLPLDKVQSIIMASNYSKLNEDGSATYNADGKVLKGPNFNPPEAYIKHALNTSID